MEFDPDRRFGLIAGNGQLPLDVAERLSAQKMLAHVICVSGEADDVLRQHPHTDLRTECLGYAVPELLRHRVTHVVLAGGIRQRPDFRALRVPARLWLDLPSIALRLVRGDDALLSILVRTLDKHGLTVVGAHEVLPEMLAGGGTLGSVRSRIADDEMAFAMSVAATLGAQDIGQAVVTAGKRVIAVEGAEGTDAMLARVAELRRNGRVSKSAQAVLAKSVKPDQERRVDLPTIGPDTVAACATAAIQTICLSAGSTLIVEAAKTVRLADDAGIAIVGWSDAR